MKDYTKQNSGNLEQLKQLVNMTWDGDLISKSDTKELWQKGLITRRDGWNVINEKGIEHLNGLKLIHC